MVRDAPVPPRNDLVWRRLSGFVRLMALGWAAALLYHYVMGALLRLPYPANTFLFDPADRFGDLINTWRQARAPDPYAAPGNAVAAYFPLVYLALTVLRRASGTWVIAIYLLLTFGAALALGLAWIRRERARWAGDSRWPVAAALALVIALANYPLLMAVDRGNVDPLITVVLAAAVASLYRGRPLLGGILLGVSAAAKGYPLVAAVLWVRRGRVLAALAAAATLVALVLLPGLAFEGGVGGTLRGLAGGLARFRELYVLGDASAHFSADALNAIRLAALWAGAAPDMARLVPAYEAVALLWAGLLCAHALLFARGTWRESLAVVLVMLVFPNVTNDYKLVLLVPVVLAWVSSEEERGWRDRVFAVCAALLLVPKHYGVLLDGRDATGSSLVSPLLLLGLTAVLWPAPDEAREARATLARVRAAVVRVVSRSDAPSLGEGG